MTTRLWIRAWGRGYSVVGGNDITIQDNYYANNVAGFAGIYIASEAEYGTLPVNNVLVKENVIVNAGGKHGSIQSYASGGTIKNVTIDSNRIYNSRNVDILLNGSAGPKWHCGHKQLRIWHPATSFRSGKCPSDDFREHCVCGDYQSEPFELVGQSQRHHFPR